MRKKDVLQVFILDYTRTKNNRVRTENRRTQPKKNEEKRRKMETPLLQLLLLLY